MRKVISGVNVNFFVDNRDIGVDPQTISTFMAPFIRFGLIPTFGMEYNPNANERRNFLRLVTPDESLQINFNNGVTSILVKDRTSVEDIQRIFFDFLSGLANLMPYKRSNRLAVLTSTLFQGETEVYNRICRNIYSIHDNGELPFEWDYRAAFKFDIAGVENNMNKVVSCRKGMNGVVPGDMFESIAIDTDINTQFENQTPRYTYIQAAQLLDTMLVESLQMQADFFQKIGVGDVK
ncbi:hypothetical protein ACK32Q_10180 [Aeromonas dhakensis]|uniref:hypothetical protein n=1 Tax=Aeromonas dhakensis TaxID=196024 RepID=UPI003987F1C8